MLEASNATDALALLDANTSISLLLTDLCLPIMNGRDLANAATAGGHSPKIMFTSAYARSAVVSLGLLDQNERLLPKPFRIETLARGVRAVLDAA